MRSNWATIHSTKRRVRLPLVVSPNDERFTCPQQDCSLSVSGCGNRHYLARTTSNPHVKEMLDGCADCVVGEANLARKPMPDLSLVHTRKQEERSMISSTSTDTKKWKDRVCQRDKVTTFTPEHAQQKACGTCPKCIHANDTGKPKKPKPGASKVAAPTSGKAPVQRIAVSTPTTDGLAGATVVLEAAGFKVRAITVPAGVMLLVSGG